MGIVIMIITALSVCAAFVLVDVAGLPYRWQGALNFKPFNCKTCLSGWLSLVLWSYQGFPVLWIPFLMCVPMVASFLFNSLIEKYL